MKFNRFFERLRGSIVTGYVLIDTSKTEATKLNKDRFETTVEFNIKMWPGDMVSNYPVVFTDFTSNDGTTLREITFKDIPAKTKARFTKWSKVQSVDVTIEHV